MNKNQNNVEDNKISKVKNLVDYFQSGQTNKNINTNINQKDKNQSSNNEIKSVDLGNNIEKENNKVDNIQKTKTYNENNKKEEINDINEEKIYNKLSIKKSKVISLLENNIKSFSTKYKDFDNNIINWYKKQSQKISKMISEKNKNINAVKTKIEEKITQILKIYENLISSIKDQFVLLDIFLNDNLLESNFPLEEFIVQNHILMINGNFLAKIDINSIYMTKIFENKDLSEIFKNYYLKRKNNYSHVKNIKLRIKNTNDLLATKEKIHEKNIDEENFSDKIKSICFDHLNLTSFPSEKIVYNNINNLEKLKIIKCINLYNTSIYKSIINNSNNLKMIKLEGIHLTNKSFNDFFSLITKINSFIKTLKYLSFRNNNLSSINLKLKKVIFEDLEMFDCSKNNIYYFSTNNFRIFPKLKILDLSENNFNNNLLFEGILKSWKSKLISFVILMSKNIFLYNVNENNQKYIKYLNQNLPNLEYNLKSINLSFLYNKNNLQEISKLKFSSAIRISLVKLNLSFCGLNDKAISNFFKNNFDLLNLKNLNLNHNFISSNFFSLFDEESDLIYIDKLEKIDLSFNSLICTGKSDLKKLIKFIDFHKFLKVIKLQNNKFLDIFKKEHNIADCNNEINTFIDISEKRKIIVEVQIQISSLLDNERFKKILLYKAKY